MLSSRKLPFVLPMDFMGQKFRKGRVSKVCLCLTMSKAAFFFFLKKKIFISDKVISIIKVKINTLP